MDNGSTQTLPPSRRSRRFLSRQPSGFIDRFRLCVDRIDIADAAELANRRGTRRNNDRNDARDVAERLARGECPPGWIADESLSQFRTLGRHRHRLWRTMSRATHSHAVSRRGANQARLRKRQKEAQVA